MQILDLTPTVLLTVLLAAGIGCGPDDKKNEPDANNGVTLDMGAADDTGASEDAETATDAGAEPDQATGDGGLQPDLGEFELGACGEDALLDSTIELDSSERTGQFYARAAWDTDGAWVVYNRRAVEDGPEEIWAVRVGCKGTIEHGPMQLSESDGNRKYTPAIDTHGGNTVVAWAVEFPGQPQVVRAAGIDREGNIAWGPTDVSPAVGGQPNEGIVWEPDVAVAPDGTAAVVTSGGTFGDLQAWIQRVDTSGDRSGDAFQVHPDPGVDQTRPSIAAGDDGTLFVSYVRRRAATDELPEDPERVVYTSIPAGANAAFPSPPLPGKPLTSPNQVGRIAKDAGPNGEFFMAFDVTTSNRADIVVRDASTFDDAITGTTGSTGYVNFRPSAAGGEEVGVVSWYRWNASPLQNELMLAGFRLQDGAYAFSEPIVIPTETPGIPPFGPDATPTGGNVYFVVWSEGDSAPQARVFGRFVAVK